MEEDSEVELGDEGNLAHKLLYKEWLVLNFCLQRQGDKIWHVRHLSCK